MAYTWISGAAFEDDSSGSIEFTPLGNETYSVSGTHRVPNGTSVTVDGTINKISDLELGFSGTIVVSVASENNGEPCVREGNTTFLSTQGRKYWRMQNATSPCNGNTDYVDIYFN